jgi:hypothetical protein
MARYMVEGGRIVLVLTRHEARGLRTLASRGWQGAAFVKKEEARGAERAWKALCSAVAPPIA